MKNSCANIYCPMAFQNVPDHQKRRGAEKVVIQNIGRIMIESVERRRRESQKWGIGLNT